MTTKLEGKVKVTEKQNSSFYAEWQYIEYTMVDASGKEWSWKSYQEVDLEVGKTYSVKATIKNESTLTRCKIF